MGREWKIGDWVEFPSGSRFLIWDIRGGYAHGINRNGPGSVSLEYGRVKHLPDCTGWDWEEPTAEKVEPAAHEWKFGEWAKTPHGNIVRFVSVDDEGDHIPAIVCAFIATLFIAFSAFVFLLNSERRHLQNEAIERNYAEWVNDGKGNPVFTWKDPTQ